jgi:uncharacterized coiled-coil DUF342 family protein
MQSKYMMIAVAASAILAGCNRDKQSVDADHSTTGQDVKDSYKNAAQATADYASETRDQFLATMRDKMAQLNAKIDDLSSKSAGYKDDTKVQADKTFDSLRAERDEVAKKYDGLKQSSQAAWQSTKDSFISAWDKLQNSYDNTKAKL